MTQDELVRLNEINLLEIELLHEVIGCCKDVLRQTEYEEQAIDAREELEMAYERLDELIGKIVQ